MDKIKYYYYYFIFRNGKTICFCIKNLKNMNYDGNSIPSYKIINFRVSNVKLFDGENCILLYLEVSFEILYMQEHE